MALINDSGEIRRIFRPLIRSWWFILTMCLVGLHQGYQSYLSGIPSFQARATIQVNDKNSSPSTFLEHFEAFSMVGKYVLELEIMRSTYLIRQAIHKLPIKVGYWTQTPSRWDQLYKKLPFRLQYEISDSSWLDRPLFIQVHEGGSWTLNFEEVSGTIGHLSLEKDQEAQYKDLKLSLESVFPSGYIAPGNYQVIIRSEEALMEIFSSMDNLLVRLQYEKVALINIYFWHPEPELATDFVNTLAQVYIEDFLFRKKEMAERALGTLRDQVSIAEGKLAKAESALVQYRDEVQVWRVSSFRKLNLDLLKESETRAINARLKVEDLQKLDSLLLILEKDQDAKINYESIRDASYLDALEQITKLQALLKREEINLTQEHPKIQSYRKDIALIIRMLKIRVSRTLQTYSSVQQDLKHQINRFKKQILRLPAIEQNLSFLQRDIAFRQRALDSLNVKYVDAYVSTMSNFTFHRILEHELPPESPIKPLIHVKVGVTALMYTLMSIFFLLFLQSFKGVITHEEDVYEYLDLPVRNEAQLNPFPDAPISQGMINLAADLILDKQVQILTLFDYKTHKDKVATSMQLGYTLAELEQRTLILYADDEAPLPRSSYPTHKNLDILEIGLGENSFPAQIIHHKGWKRTLEQFCIQYDFIILVAGGIKKSQDILPFMLHSHLNLYIAGLFRTKIAQLAKVQDFLEEHSIPNAELLLLSNPPKNKVVRLIESVRVQLTG